MGEGSASVGSQVFQNAKIAGIVLVVIVIAVLLSKSTGNSAKYKKYSSHQIRTVQKMVRQASKWHTMANQDSNLLITLIHLNYGLSYAKIAVQLTSPEDIEKISGIDIETLIHQLEKKQNSVIDQIGAETPEMKVNAEYATNGNSWV